MRERRIEELAERTRRGAGAEREAAPAVRHELAERADHHRERAAGQPEADQHAGREIEADDRVVRAPSRRAPRRRAARRGTARAPGRTGRRTRRRTAAPRPRAGSVWRCEARTPRGPSRVERQRREELAERRARPERDQRDDAADGNQHHRRPPRCKLRRRGRGGSRHGIPRELAWDMPRRWRSLGTGRRGPKRNFVMVSICAAHGCMADPRAAPPSHQPRTRLTPVAGAGRPQSTAGARTNDREGTGAAAREVLSVLLEVRITSRGNAGCCAGCFRPPICSN